MASTSSTFQKMILLRLLPEFPDDSFIKLPTTVSHTVGFMILVCLLLLMHTSLTYEFEI
ncbi:hypothetical protein T12_1021 [Trichinella patagoniensis]|uniref:Uncharacterized protein n=1 Tax=Trichinella patagoniensis TaxID=990121 RepID=A0A0V0YTU2_9BILA|nr:hypothetical protein T12_1021 [Trichinella patagoniensis]